MVVLPPLKPNAWGLTLNINFGHIQDCHHPNVRHTNPYASYFVHGLTSNAALLHLAQLVTPCFSQGLEVSRCIVKGKPESERIFFVGMPMGWSVDGVVCHHLLTCFQLGKDSMSSSSQKAPASHQMWPFR